jgi:hypothetical protein
MRGFFSVFGGELGIRTLETLLTFAGFQDRYGKASAPPLSRGFGFRYFFKTTGLQTSFHAGRALSFGTHFAHSQVPLRPLRLVLSRERFAVSRRFRRTSVCTWYGAPPVLGQRSINHALAGLNPVSRPLAKTPITVNRHA